MTDEAGRIRWSRIRQRPLLPPGPRGWLVALERSLYEAIHMSRLIAAYDAFFENADATLVITVDTERLDPRQEDDLAAIALALAGVREGEEAARGSGR